MAESAKSFLKVILYLYSLSSLRFYVFSFNNAFQLAYKLTLEVFFLFLKS